jgi:tricorn protease interacting factor F2/3
VIISVETPEAIAQTFDEISYNKGSIIVKMIYNILEGTNSFQDGINCYLNEYQYRNTKSTDLWRVWSEENDYDIEKLMETWTKEQGYPYVSVVGDVQSSTESNVTITLEQHRFLADGSPTEAGAGKPPVWSIPLF